MPKLSKKCWLDKTGKINCFLLGNQFYTHSNFHQIVCCLVSTSEGLWSFCGVICQNLFLYHNVKNSHIRNLFKKKPEQNSKGWRVNLRKYSLLSLWGTVKGGFTFPNFGLILFSLCNHFHLQQKRVEDQSQRERGWYTTEDR